MDISDLNFKPCVCGYQVRCILSSSPYHTMEYPTVCIRFAASAGIISRRISTSAAPLAVEFTQMKLLNSSLLIPRSRCLLDIALLRCSHTLSHKRLMQQKKQRERERKELDALGRRHLANVRVVQRNVVYVVGIGPRFAKEEVSLFPFTFVYSFHSHSSPAHSNPSFK